MTQGELSMSSTFSRRAAVLGAAALPIIRGLKAQSKSRPVVISSANRFDGGVNCCTKAVEAIKAGDERAIGWRQAEIGCAAELLGLDLHDPDFIACGSSTAATDVYRRVETKEF